jgi:hypothetical protein
MDVEPALLAALAHRAAGLPVETAVADARRFALSRRFSLILVPMQTLQLLEGAQGRAAFLRCALAHLEPGGLLAAAVADAMDCFDDVHAMPPPPAAQWVGERRYASRLLSVAEEDGRAALHRRREISGASGCRHAEDVLIHLDRVSAAEVAAEAAALGFAVEPSRQIPETERYLGSAVAMLRAPHSPGHPAGVSDRRRRSAARGAQPGPRRRRGRVADSAGPSGTSWWAREPGARAGLRRARTDPELAAGRAS